MTESFFDPNQVKLSPVQVQARLREWGLPLGEQRIRALMRAGALPYVEVSPRRRFILESALREYVTRNVRP